MFRQLLRPFSSPVFLRGEKESVLKKSMLPNGVKVISESSRFPGSISLGIVVQVGIRNDPVGYLDLYKDTFLRSRSQADQKAYSTLELAGCDVSLVLERENLYIHTTCLEEHLDVVLPALKQSIFSSKLQMDVADSLQRLNILEPEKNEEKIKHMILTAAYGGSTLGIRHPRLERIPVTHSDYCDFIDSHFTSEKLTIAASGIEDPNAFESIVSNNFGDIPKGSFKNEASIYKAQTLRETLTDDTMTHYSIGFQGAAFTDSDMPALNVLKTIIGDGGGFSTGGPGKGMYSRAYTTILPQGFIESVKTQHLSFSDSGVFSVSLVGLEKYAQYLPIVVVKELTELLKLEQPELDRAKNIIIREVLINYQKTVSRIEDIAKNCANFYMTPDEFGYLKKINQVSLKDIKVAIVRMLQGNFCVWTATKNTTNLTELDVIYKQLGTK
jgi:processing peptidase subunit alpha